MEMVEDIVIVGAGISGLSTALGLHRLGVRCLVLESSDRLRSSGFAFLNWTNAWRALDALGIGEPLRRQHVRLQGIVTASIATGLTTSHIKLDEQGKLGEHELRCVKRNLLLEALAKELSTGTIKFGSKVVSIEEAGSLKLLHLADGSIIRTKVLIGCDGVNSVVAKWMGLKKAAFAGRSATRGIAEFPNGHGFKPEYLLYFGDGFRSGFLPCDEKYIYWFFTYTSTDMDKEVKESPMKMKQFVSSKLAKLPEIARVVEKSELSGVGSSQLRFRWPFDLLYGGICKDNVCLAGDALHTMTPDLGQGGCSALEDGVVLARCLGEAFLGESNEGQIKKGIEKYANERRWRSFGLISSAYLLGWIQQSGGSLMNFLRDNWLSHIMAKKLLNIADFDCGKLTCP